MYSLNTTTGYTIIKARHVVSTYMGEI